MRQYQILKHKAQKGVVTILMVFLVGLMMAATLYTVVNSAKGYQESTLTAHSLTQAQLLAWKADYAVNQYLTNVYCGGSSTCASSSVTNLTNLSTGAITLTGLTGVTANISANTFGTLGSSGTITVNITATNSGASANVQSVHALSSSSGGLSTYSFNYGLVVGGNSTFNGSIAVNGTNGSAAPGIAVKGNLTVNGSGNTYNQIVSTGNVSLTGNTNITNLAANGNLTVTGSYNLSNIAIGGSYSVTGNGSSSGAVGGSASVPSYETSNNAVTQNATVTPVTINIPTVDATPLRNSANYIFDLNNGVASVYVQNVANIATGWYQIGSSNVTSANTVVAQQICKSYSAYNNCISYSGGTWTFSGLGMSPGIAWFNGNVIFNGGPATYPDTIIATGNITENGSITITAFNLATAATACTGTYYPTNYCANGKQTGATIGNTELMAGAYTNGVFGGGQITLNGSAVNTGDIIAGQSLIANGNITVTGEVLVAAQGLASGANALTLNGSLVVNLTQSNGADTSTVQTGSTTSATMGVAWSRYQ